MSFDDIRLSPDLEAGALSMPEWNTGVVSLVSRKEQRNQNWADAKRRWDISYGIRDMPTALEIYQFHMGRRGRLRAFRFKDWLDYFMARQQIGIGDGSKTEFQIIKIYSASVHPYERAITLPVEDTVEVWVNDSLMVSGWSVNLTTGVITFNSPPSAGHSIEVACEFDVRVRFESDTLSVFLEFIKSVNAEYNLGGIQSVMIQESPE